MANNLSEIIESWPGDHPQNLVDLVNADREDISSQQAWDLRHQAVTLLHSSEKHVVMGPGDAFKLISNSYFLKPWDKAWKSFALSPMRQPIVIPGEGNRWRYLSKGTRLIPRVDDLPPLPGNRTAKGKPYAWLVIFGGNPDILDKDGVARGLTTLSKRVPVIDFLFYESAGIDVKVATLWSVKAGVGQKGSVLSTAEQVSFPNPNIVDSLGEFLL